jgi:putative FmdB family regulatory protein
MALYDYQCAACGPFSLWRPLSERNFLASCPVCQEPARRVISAPNLSVMSPSQRLAHARNEKSRHEPGVTNRHRCGSGCGCGRGSPARKKATRTVDLGKAGRFEASKTSKRPWMLGH